MVETNAICTLGEINLLPSETEKNSNVYYIEALGEESSWGDPETVITEIASQLIEGTAIGVSTTGNRNATLKVQIIGANSAALAIGERDLIDTCSQDGLIPLRFLNPDQTAAITVFDVIYTHVAANFADLDDERLTGGKRREYTLTLTCKPWPRSEYALESAPDVEPGHEPNPLPPDVLVSDGSEIDQWRINSDAQWGPDDHAHDAVDEATWQPSDDQAVWGAHSERVKLWWPNHVNTKGTPWLAIRGYTRSGSNYRHDEQLIFHVNDVETKPERISHDKDKGSFRAYVWVGDAGVPKFGITAVAKVSNTWAILAIDSVYATAGLPSSDTGKVQARTIDVQASKPVEGSVEVRGYDTSGFLDSVGHWTFIYSAPADGSQFNPSLASWRSPSGPVRTSGEVPLSGGYSQLEFTASGADTFLVPIDLFAPGTYQIGALLADANAEGGKHQVNWDCQTRFDSNVYSTTSGVANPTLPAWVQSSGQPLWKYCPLGDVVLPLDEFVNPEVTVYQRFRIWAPEDPDVARVRFDTLLLFNMSIGSLTVVDTGPHGDHDCVGVRLDAPTSDRPEPAVWVDMLPTTSAHRLYTMSAGTRAKSRGIHHFDPGGTFLWTATSENARAGVTVTYYPRWHTYASYVTTLPYPSITSPTNGDILSSLDEIVGTGEPGYTITVTLNRQLYGTTTVDTDGDWSFVMRPLPDGDHLIAAYQSNDMGQASDPAVAAFIIDTAPPSTPVITTPTDGTLTNEDRPRFAGTVRGATSITLTASGTALAETYETRDGENVVLGTTDVAANGTWSLTPTTPFTDGEFTVTATAVDRAGNESPTSTPVTVTIDLTEPDQPVITSPTMGGLAGAESSFTGTGEPGSTVTLTMERSGYSQSWTYWIVVADDGTWSHPIQQQSSNSTECAVDAYQRDPAGNLSTTTAPVEFTLRTTPVPPPGVTTFTATQVAGYVGWNTHMGEVITGTTVSLTIDGTLLDDAIPADEDGDWSYVFDPPLTDGDHTVSVTNSDEFGNVSEPTVQTLAIDATAPAPPVVTTVDGEPYEGQEVVYTASYLYPALRGTGEPGAEVSVTLDSQPWSGVDEDNHNTIVVSEGGTWSFHPNTSLRADGAHVVAVYLTDAGGNTSQPATVHLFGGEITATNLAIDPSFELGETSGYWDVGTSGSEWVDESNAGSQSIQIPAGNKKILSTWWLPPSGGTFDLAVRVKVTGNTTPSIRFANLDGTTPGGAVEVGETDGWSVYAATGVTLASASTASAYWRISLGTSGGSQVTEFIEVDAVIVAAADELADPAEYFDGDTPGTDAARYQWTGEPHASTSIKIEAAT